MHSSRGLWTSVSVHRTVPDNGQCLLDLNCVAEWYFDKNLS